MNHSSECLALGSPVDRACRFSGTLGASEIIVTFHGFRESHDARIRHFHYLNHFPVPRPPLSRFLRDRRIRKCKRTTAQQTAANPRKLASPARHLPCRHGRHLRFKPAIPAHVRPALGPLDWITAETPQRPRIGQRLRLSLQTYSSNVAIDQVLRRPSVPLIESCRCLIISDHRHHVGIIISCARPPSRCYYPQQQNNAYKPVHLSRASRSYVSVTRAFNGCEL